MARIGLAPVLGYLIVEEDFHVALGVFALAGITDLVRLMEAFGCGFYFRTLSTGSALVKEIVQSLFI